MNEVSHSHQRADNVLPPIYISSIGEGRKMQNILRIALLGSLINAGLTKDCTDLGFPGSPLCTDCDKLFEFAKDEGLLQECKRCCQSNQGETASQRFESAVLEICKFRMREFPQVEGFVDNRLPDFGSVRVSYKWGAPPRLILKSSSKQKESIRIDSWTTDNIAEYLEQKLVDTVPSQS